MAAKHLAHLDGHVSGLTFRPRRRRSSSGDFVGFLSAVHIDNPVPREKFLRFWEDAVRDGLSVPPSADDLGLGWPPQALGGDKNPSSLSCLLKARIKATFRSRSSLDHFAYLSKSAFVPVIIRIYFIRFPALLPFCFFGSAFAGDLPLTSASGAR